MELNFEFPEIFQNDLDKFGFRAQFALKASDKASQVAKEARAGTMAVRHLARSREFFRKRPLLFGDNLSVILAFTKGRSSVFPLSEYCRRIMCVSVAMGSSLCFRWIPSEFNEADWLSRVYQAVPNAASPLIFKDGGSAL